MYQSREMRPQREPYSRFRSAVLGWTQQIGFRKGNLQFVQPLPADSLLRLRSRRAPLADVHAP